MNDYRLFTWNILAPEWAGPRVGDDRDFYRHVHPFDEWSYRRGLLLNALRDVEADVICLQEVSRAFFRRELRSFLRARGLVVTCRVRTTGSGPIGVLVAHDPRRFGLVRPVEFRQADLRGRVAAVELRPVGGDRNLVVATTHLPWSPLPEVRAERLDRALAVLNARPETEAQMFVGDINFDPHAHAEWPRWAAAGWSTSHPQPDMPTWAADGRTERLDAILARRGITELQGEPVPALSPLPGLPSATFPSDHVPLAATFRL